MSKLMESNVEKKQSIDVSKEIQDYINNHRKLALEASKGGCYETYHYHMGVKEGAMVVSKMVEQYIGSVEIKVE